MNDRQPDVFGLGLDVLHLLRLSCLGNLPLRLRRIMAGFARMIALFNSANTGNTGLMFGMALLPVVGLVGFGIDYSRALSVKAGVDSMADTAVLASLAPKNINPLLTISQQDNAAKAAALASFNAFAIPTGGMLQSVDANVARTTNSITVTLTFAVSVETTLSKVLGLNTINIAGKASAASIAKRYIDIYVLADSSASMGIGATMADQTLMSAVLGCTIACHADGTDTLARNAGAVLRFDAAKSALATIVSQAQNGGGGNIVRFGLYSFATALKTEIDITSNLPSVASAVSAMQLAGYGAGTNIKFALDSVSSKISAYGDGSSPASPLVYVLLLSDVVGNSVDNQSLAWQYSGNFTPATPHAIPDPLSNGQMDLSGLNPAWCQPLKTSGAQMMTLELQYIVPVAQLAYDLRSQYINTTLKPGLSSSMQACASNPGLWASANTPNDVSLAAQQLFKQTMVSSPRLIQ